MAFYSASLTNRYRFPSEREAMELQELFRNPEFYVPFAAGQTVFKEGEQGEVMYVIMEGEVDVFIRGNLIATFGPGEIIGEMGVIEPMPRSASAVAKTVCKLAPMNQKRFLLLVQQTPKFALHIMQVLAGRLRRLDELITESGSGH